MEKIHITYLPSNEKQINQTKWIEINKNRPDPFLRQQSDPPLSCLSFPNPSKIPKLNLSTRTRALPTPAPRRPREPCVTTARSGRARRFLFRSLRFAIKYRWSSARMGILYSQFLSILSLFSFANLVYFFVLLVLWLVLCFLFCLRIVFRMEDDDRKLCICNRCWQGWKFLLFCFLACVLTYLFIYLFVRKIYKYTFFLRNTKTWDLCGLQ